jgi:NADH-quinone oxidoreductase subunit N
MPMVAVISTVAMVSLTGLPPTAGFIAKLRLFLAGIESYQSSENLMIVILLVAVLLNTVVSLFYYLRVSSTMIFGNPLVKSAPRFHGLIPVILVIMCVATIWLGIFSFDRLINFLNTLPPFVRG